MAHVITGAFSSGLAALVTGGQGAGDGARAEPAGVIDDVATRRLAAVSLCTALLQSPSASALFFSSDVEVLVRVCLQQLEDLPPADTARLAFLRLLRQASLVLLRPSPSGAVSPNACVLGDIAVECLVALVEAGRSNAVSPGGAQASGTSLSRRLSASMSPSSSSAPAVSLAALPTPSKALAVLPPSPASPEPASVLQSSHQRFSLPSAVVREAQVTLEQIREALPLGKSL